MAPDLAEGEEERGRTDQTQRVHDLTAQQEDVIVVCHASRVHAIVLCHEPDEARGYPCLQKVNEHSAHAFDQSQGYVTVADEWHESGEDDKE